MGSAEVRPLLPARIVESWIEEKVLLSAGE